MKNLKAAFEVYNRTASYRDRLMDAAKTDAAIAKWQAVEERARLKLCRALYEDTKEYNRREDCFRCTVSTMERMMKRAK